MRIRMGFLNQVDGYLEDRPDNTIAVVDTTSPEAAANMTALVAHLFDPTRQTAVQFLLELPQRYTGQTWAQNVAQDGILGDLDRRME